jgi:hypothetical protein
MWRLKNLNVVHPIAVEHHTEVTRLQCGLPWLNSGISTIGLPARIVSVIKALHSSHSPAKA